MSSKDGNFVVTGFGGGSIRSRSLKVGDDSPEGVAFGSSTLAGPRPSAEETCSIFLNMQILLFEVWAQFHHLQCDSCALAVTKLSIYFSESHLMSLALLIGRNSPSDDSRCGSAAGRMARAVV